MPEPIEPPEEQPAPEEQPPSGETEELGDKGKQALDRMKAERNEAARQAKALQRELEQVRTASMSEAEKVAHEAEQRGRQAATAEFGQRLARTQFDALAGRRNADVDTAKVLEYVDLSKFVGEDGEPDLKAITAAVERLVPAPAGGTPSFDGGGRSKAAAPKDMNALIRDAAGVR